MSRHLLWNALIAGAEELGVIGISRAVRSDASASVVGRPDPVVLAAATAPETVARVAAAPTLTRENTPPSGLLGRCSLATLSPRPERRRAPGICRWSARHTREPGRSGLVRSCPARSSCLPPTGTNTRLGPVRIPESQKVPGIEQAGAPWPLTPPSPPAGSAAAASSPFRPKSARRCTWPRATTSSSPAR